MISIAGLVPLSTVDWPGKLAAVVFLQGCPWDCGYCQNPELRDCLTPGQVPFAAVLALLERRRGLLDGVVFSGGEPVRQAGLARAMRRVREGGFGVGLHTAGAYPTRLREVLPFTDWVGIDIKALPEDYGAAVGVASGGAKAWDSLESVARARRERAGSDRPLEAEVRLTVHPDSPQAAGALEIARRVRDLGFENFALQDARTDGARRDFVERAALWDREAWCAELNELEERIDLLGFRAFASRR